MLLRFLWALTARLTRATSMTPIASSGGSRGRGLGLRPTHGRPAMSYRDGASTAQQPLDPLHVHLGGLDPAGQPPGPPGGLLLQVVAQAGLLDNDLAAPGQAGPFAHAGMALHLRHFDVSPCTTRRWTRRYPRRLPLRRCAPRRPPGHRRTG